MINCWFYIKMTEYCKNILHEWNVYLMRVEQIGLIQVEIFLAFWELASIEKTLNVMLKLSSLWLCWNSCSCINESFNSYNTIYSDNRKRILSSRFNCQYKRNICIKGHISHVFHCSKFLNIIILYSLKIN